MQLHIHQLHLKCIVHEVRTFRLVLTLLWHYHLHGNLHSICCFHTYDPGLDLLMIHAVHFDHNLLIVLSLQMIGSSSHPLSPLLSLCQITLRVHQVHPNLQAYCKCKCMHFYILMNSYMHMNFKFKDQGTNNIRVRKQYVIV